MRSYWLTHPGMLPHLVHFQEIKSLDELAAFIVFCHAVVGHRTELLGKYPIAAKNSIGIWCKMNSSTKLIRHWRRLVKLNPVSMIYRTIGARQHTVTLCPCRRRAIAAVNPPIPAPAIAMFKGFIGSLTRLLTLLGFVLPFVGRSTRVVASMIRRMNIKNEHEGECKGEHEYKCSEKLENLMDSPSYPLGRTEARKGITIPRIW